MLWWQYEQQLFLKQGNIGKKRGIGRQQGNRQVGFGTLGQRFEFHRRVFYQGDINAGILLLENGQKARQQMCTAERRGANRQMAAAQIQYIIRLLPELFLQCQDLTCGLQIQAANVGGTKWRSAAVEKRAADLLFQFLQELTQGGLRDIEFLGG